MDYQQFIDWNCPEELSSLEAKALLSQEETSRRRLVQAQAAERAAVTERRRLSETVAAPYYDAMQRELSHMINKEPIREVKELLEQIRKRLQITVAEIERNDCAMSLHEITLRVPEFYYRICRYRPLRGYYND